MFETRALFFIKIQFPVIFYWTLVLFALIFLNIKTEWKGSILIYKQMKNTEILIKGKKSSLEFLKILDCQYVIISIKKFCSWIWSLIYLKVASSLYILWHEPQHNGSHLLTDPMYCADEHVMNDWPSSGPPVSYPSSYGR